MSDIEYRANMVIKIIVDLLWYAAQLSVFEVLYQYTNTIGGWSHEQTRVFMGVLFVTDSIYMILFHENLEQVSYMVKKGELDLLLTKPISSQFIVSCKKVNITYIGNLILTSVFLIWALTQLQTHIGFVQILMFLFSIIFSLSVTYCFRLCFSVLSFIYHNSQSITYIWYQMYRFGTRPDSMYPGVLRYFLLSLFPVAFIASVPSRFLVEGPIWELFFVGLIVSFLFLFITKKFWDYAVTKYSSASS